MGLSQEDGFLSLFGGGLGQGLNIGTSSVKLVQMKGSGKSWKLEHFAMALLPEDAVLGREISNAVAVRTTIDAVLGQSRLRGRNICTGISGSSVMLKRMTVESPSKKELQAAVFWEAEQYLPFDPNEIAMDFHLLGPLKNNSYDVIFIAAKLQTVDGYSDVVQESGLVPKVIDSEYFSVQNVFEANYTINPGEAVALVEIGAVAMRIQVVQDGAAIYTKDAAIGGRNLTQEIQKHLSLSFSDAESLKVNSGSSATPPEVHEMMEVTAENFAIELKRALDFYNASSTGAPVAYALLCGGGAKLPNLSRIVEDRVGIPTQMLNPFAKIKFDESKYDPAQIQEAGPMLVVPMGLAMRMSSE